MNGIAGTRTLYELEEERRRSADRTVDAFVGLWNAEQAHLVPVDPEPVEHVVRDLHRSAVCAIEHALRKMDRRGDFGIVVTELGFARSQMRAADTRRAMACLDALPVPRNA